MEQYVLSLVTVVWANLTERGISLTQRHAMSVSGFDKFESGRQGRGRVTMSGTYIACSANLRCVLTDGQIDYHHRFRRTCTVNSDGARNFTSPTSASVFLNFNNQQHLFLGHVQTVTHAEENQSTSEENHEHPDLYWNEK